MIINDYLICKIWEKMIKKQVKTGSSYNWKLIALTQLRFTTIPFKPYFKQKH